MSKLIDAIEEYKVGFRKKAPVEVQKIMVKATEELADSKISKNALKVGDFAKEINLPNALGEEVSLFKTLENNEYAIVNFYRGVWCPYCNLELKSLQSYTEEFAKLGASLIAVSPQSTDSSLTTKEKNELTFEVLSDNNNIVAKEYGLVFSLADELKPIYLSFGIDIPSNNQEDSYEIPMPATYVINKKREIVFAFIDEDYTKRCEPQDIIDTLKAL